MHGRGGQMWAKVQKDNYVWNWLKFVEICWNGRRLWLLRRHNSVVITIVCEDMFFPNMHNCVVIAFVWFRGRVVWRFRLVG